MPTGRPSKFKPEYIEQASKLTALGATELQLSDFFGINAKTLSNWKNAHPDFLLTLKSAKAEYDNRVEISLAQRAMGYSHPEEKIFCKGDEVTRVETIKHYPPDTTACIFWLKNRQPERWRDVQERVNHFAPEEEINEMELARRIAFLLTDGLQATQH